MVGVALQNTALYNRQLEHIRQLRLANENLLELDRLKSEFLRNVNHELRTPLTVVLTYLSVLLEQHQPGSLTHEFLTVAFDKSTTLKGLLENLLELSAAAQDRLVLDTVVGDVTATLEAYYAERLPGVTQGLREFTYIAAADLPRVRYDRQRLVEIVNAFVENAEKFTRPGAQITLRVDSVIEDDQPWIRISVQDDGPGIPAERIPVLFQSFRQVDGSPTREVGGMGIGLALAERVATKMGGRVTVVSEIGVGSTFILWLPEVKGETSPAPLAGGV
jgi:signal transduction histidine kinase